MTPIIDLCYYSTNQVNTIQSMHRAVKVRLYPTSHQKETLKNAFGASRWVWNYCLALNNQTYKETGKGIAGMEMKKLLPSLKKQEDTAWLKDTYAQCLQSSVLNLSQAFVNFFEKRAGYPKFKSRQGKQSLQYPQNVKVKPGRIHFPKIGDIQANLHRLYDGELKTVTITKTQTDKYYASLLLEIEGDEKASCQEGKAIGIDLGLTHFAITSDGSKYNNPRHFQKHERNLKRKGQKLSRKQKGSNSRVKAKRLVARAHEKISNARQDFLHKLSRKIISENQVIIVENLNIKGMVRNHKLAKSISDCGWSMFLNFLDYKAKWDGKTYLEIDRFFPSSKSCNVCLNIVDSLPLDIRSWECQSCKTLHDRDINAAINIRDEGLRVLSSGTGETADGGSVRPKGGRKSKLGRLPVKSEAHTVCDSISVG